MYLVSETNKKKNIDKIFIFSFAKIEDHDDE